MSLFVQIVELHEDLLKTRGYDEAGLSSPDKPGWFMKQFERELSLAIQGAHVYNEPCDFQLKTAGFFNKDADLILFTFHYEYDPQKTDVQLKRLDAKMDGREIGIDLKRNADLPSSATVHRSLSPDKKLDLARTIAEHTVSKVGKRILKN